MAFVTRKMFRRFEAKSLALASSLSSTLAQPFPWHLGPISCCWSCGSPSRLLVGMSGSLGSDGRVSLASREAFWLGGSTRQDSELSRFSWFGHVQGGEQKATLTLFARAFSTSTHRRNPTGSALGRRLSWRAPLGRSCLRLVAVS